MEGKMKSKTGRIDPFSQFITILNACGCILTMFLMVIIMIDIVGRAIFNIPLTGTPELVVASIVIIAFLQLSYVQLIDEHLKVTIFYDKFPVKVKLFFKTANYILGIIVFVFMVKSSYGFLLKSLASGEFEGEGALTLPMWPVRFTIFFCSILMILIQARQVFQGIMRLKRGDLSQ
jgi:TRAP-type C4-dicarboxylate transport system permease small subunit